MRETRELESSELPSKIITASVVTDAGCVRDSNEDSARHVHPNDAEMRREKGVLTVVADGMGGHASGEVASLMAVELIGELYYGDQSGALQALPNALREANRQIYDTAVSDKKYCGMGTTVVALVIFGETAFTAHIGDSRAYRLRGGNLELLTLDHSQVMEMVKQGIISMEEAHTHDDKNIILRAVGTQPSVEAEVSEVFEIQPGDEFLLCSDGLSDMLDDAEILQVWLSAAGDIYLASERLIARAKENGGHDNVTVGIVKISFADSEKTNNRVPITREFSITAQTL